jgi:hypothetical protein
MQIELDDQEREVFRKSWNDIKDDQAAVRIVSAYQTKVQRHAPCCIGLVEQFFYQTRIKLNQQKKSPMKSNYELRKNAVIFLQKRNMHVTNANLTDELAREILNERPGRASEFTKIPAEGEGGSSDNGGGNGGNDLSLKSNKQLKEMLESHVEESELKKLKTKQLLIDKINELQLV